MSLSDGSSLCDDKDSRIASDRDFKCDDKIKAVNPNGNVDTVAGTKIYGKITFIVCLEQLPAEIVGSEILECLSAADLLSICLVNKHLNRLANSDGLWRKLVYLDFAAERILNSGFLDPTCTYKDDSPGSEVVAERLPAETRSNRNSSVAPSDMGSTTIGNKIKHEGIKKLYLDHLENFVSITRKRKLEHEWRQKRENKEKKRRKIGCALFLFNDKFIKPMFGLAPFTTLVLLGTEIEKLESIEDYHVNAWIVFTPLFILFGLLSVSIANGIIMFTYRDERDSILYGLWGKFHGFVYIWIHKILGDSALALISGCFINVLAIIFLILLCLQLETIYIGGNYDHIDENWNVTSVPEYRMPWTYGVFVPIWIVLIVFIAIPALGWKIYNSEMFSSIICLYWVPITVFFLLLGLFLDGILNTYLYTIFIPLWITLGFNLGATLIYVFYSCCKRDASGAIFVFVFTWMLLSPVTIFLVLFSAKFPPFEQDFTYTEIMSPLCLWFFSLSLFLIILAITTPFPTISSPIPQHAFRSQGQNGGFNQAGRSNLRVFRDRDSHRVWTSRSPNISRQYSNRRLLRADDIFSPRRQQNSSQRVESPITSRDIINDPSIIEIRIV